LWVMLQSAGTVCSQRRGISSVREVLGGHVGCTDVVGNGHVDEEIADEPKAA